jgi:hypothetical protein
MPKAESVALAAAGLRSAADCERFLHALMRDVLNEAVTLQAAKFG